jgi:hypothetical protein
MKNLKSLLFSFLLILLAGTASGQTFPWTAFFGGAGPDFATDIRQTSDNGYIVAGYGAQGNSSDYYIVKLDMFGNQQWQRNISKDAYSARAHSVLETPGGDFIVIGRATQLRRPWLVKLNSGGDTLWTSQFTTSLPTNSALQARGVLLPDGRIVVIGAGGDLGLIPKMFIVSQDGELLSQPPLNAPVPPGWYSGTSVSHVEPTNDGGFILTGSAGGGSSSKSYLWKFDQNADSSWVKVFSGQNMRFAESVKELAGGGYIVAGTDSPNSDHSAAIRTDAEGNVIWFQTYPDSQFTNATDVIEWYDGSFLMTEKRFGAVGATFFQSALLTLDSDGELLSRDMIMASDSSTTITRMQRTSDGGFVMAGEINEYMVVNQQDLFVLKSDAEGNISGAGVDYVWPGDVNYDGIVNMDDLMILGVTTGATGPARFNPSIEWSPQYVTNWADTVVTGVNYKHADTDGNGIVNADDTLAILANYGLSWQTTNKRFLASSPLKSANLETDLYILPEEAVLSGNVNVEIPLYLGTSEFPISEIYGMRFSITADVDVVSPGNIGVDFAGSWLGSPGNQLWVLQKALPEQGSTDVGLTLVNHQPVSGHGMIGMLKFTMVQPLQPGEVLTLELHFDHLMGYRYDLSPIELSTGAFEVLLDNNITGLNNRIQTSNISIFPNPVLAGQPATIQSDLSISAIEILSITGLLLDSQIVGISSRQFTVPDRKGVYLIKIHTSTGISTKRLVVN